VETASHDPLSPADIESYELLQDQLDPHSRRNRPTMSNV
jgi:hypothetical protein